MNSDWKYEIGATVHWSSKGGGREKEKVGKVVARCPAGADAYVPTGGARGSLGSRTSQNDRYIVRANGRWYGPTRVQIDGAPRRTSMKETEFDGEIKSQ